MNFTLWLICISELDILSSAYKQFECSINSQKLRDNNVGECQPQIYYYNYIQTIYKRLITSFTKTEKFSHLCTYTHTHTHTQETGSLIQPHPWIKNKEQNSPICCSSFGRRVVRTQRMERSHYLSSRHKNLFPWMSFLAYLSAV